MYIIHDQRIPKEATENLRSYGTLIPFCTYGITHEALAGHPDIFFCQVDGILVASPDIPEIFLRQLRDHGIEVEPGQKPVALQNENTNSYNAVVTPRFLIHRKKCTDPGILGRQGSRSFVEVRQSYTRCSLIPLRDDHFITSDRGIEKKLKQYTPDVYFIRPEEIVLPGFPYGLIGGCAGVCGNRIFFIGSLDHHAEGSDLRKYLTGLDYEIIELYRGKLYDGGSLFFMEGK